MKTTISLIIPPVWGFAQGLIHRLYFSPRINKLKPVTQSIGTPAVGVLWSFVPFVASFALLLKAVLNGRKTIEANLFFLVSVMCGAYSFITVFLFYGAAVAMDIAAVFWGRR